MDSRWFQIGSLAIWIEGMLLWSIPVRRFRALHLMRLWWSSVSVLVNPWSPTHRDERCLPVSKARDVKCGVTSWDYMSAHMDFVWISDLFWILDPRKQIWSQCTCTMVPLRVNAGRSCNPNQQGILHLRDMAISPNETIRTNDSWLGRCRLSARVERLFTWFLQVRHQDWRGRRR